MKFRGILVILLLLLNSTAQAVGSKIVWEAIDWQVLKGENFDIYYPPGYDRLARLTLLYAEEANITISRKLRHHLTQVIPVFVYPSHGHFQGTNIIWESIDEGTGGFTERMKKRIAVPFMGSYDDFRHVVTHELVHAFQYDILLGGGFSSIFASTYASQPPLWFIEGMAEYLSLGWDESADMMLRDAALTETLPTIEMMTDYRVLNGFIFYKGGQSILRFIDETWGEEKIGEILRDLRDQRGIEEAIRVNLGISLKQFDESWRLWVKRRYYKQIDKKFDEEEGLLLSDHFEDESFFNLHPAISPDGSKVAYLSIRNFFPAIVLREIKQTERKPNYRLDPPPEPDRGKILVQGGNNAEFHQLNLLNNRLSFTPDGKKIFFAARSQGQEKLVLFDIEKKKVIQSWAPPLDMVQQPMLSPDGQKAVFSGGALGQTDIYLLELNTSALRRLTRDTFYDRDPVFSGDGSRILFSSNRNPRGDAEERNYHIFELNLSTNTIEQLTFEPGKQLTPMYYSTTGYERIAYISNHTGSRNAYLKDRTTGTVLQITNTSGGIFEPMFSQNRELMVFAHYRRQGYDIAIRKAPAAPADFLTYDTTVVNYEPPKFPVYPGGLSLAEPESYLLKASPDFFFFGFQYSSFFGFGGFLTFLASDYTGNHQLSTFLDYLSNRQAANFNLSYGFLKYRINYFFGAYRVSNYFSIFNLTNLASINDFLYFPTFIYSTSRYGTYATVQVPFTPFFSLAGQVEIGRYEEIYYKGLPLNYRRKDIFTNINSLNLAVNYNNAVYSYFGPLNGWALRYVLEQTLNTSGRDFVYSRQSIDTRRYFFFGKRYVFAWRLSAGHVSGPQADYFPWQIGGFNSIRGYPFLSIKGTTMLVNNLELRYPFLDALIFGFPVPWVMRGFSGVIFWDMGGATENPATWRAFRRDGARTQDLFISYGLGIRIALFPGLLFKIDWATPYNLKTALPVSKWQGIFSLGYEF